MVKDNIALVQQNIAEACKKASRDPKEVTLVAVSKTKPCELIEEAYATGIRDFGENKVKEIVTKKPLLPDDIRWHMIGHLQTNKVKQVIDKAVLIHSIDTTKLADCIDVEAGKAGITVEGLLEVNVAGEASKYGFALDDVIPLMERLELYKHLRIVGLMTVAPDVENPEENRAVFRNLCKLSVDMNSKRVDNINMKVLSMGMTGDYQVAIQEGATIVRVGTGIFGARERIER